MVRLMALCSLPRSNPGNRLQFKRVNGPYKLYMIAGGGNKLPFGNLPRLLLAWVCTEAVRTQSRELVLGRSLAEFMRQLGMQDDSGSPRGDRTRLRNQMQRLFHCQVELIYMDEHGERFVASRVADRGEFWWDPKRPGESTLWESKIELGEKFFNEIIQHPVPLDMNILKALKRCSWASISTSGSTTGPLQSGVRCSSPGGNSIASSTKIRLKHLSSEPSRISAIRFSGS